MKCRSRPGVECRSWPGVERDLSLGGARFGLRGGVPILAWIEEGGGVACESLEGRNEEEKRNEKRAKKKLK